MFGKATPSQRGRISLRVVTLCHLQLALYSTFGAIAAYGVGFTWHNAATRELTRNVRLVCDKLRMTGDTRV
jgi:hypothetical protein